MGDYQVNRKQFYERRRAYRVLRYRDYDENYRGYEKMERMAKVFRPFDPLYDRGYELLYLYGRMKNAIHHGVDPEKAKQTFRRCISSNTAGRLTFGQSYPCYWDGR